MFALLLECLFVFSWMVSIKRLPCWQRVIGSWVRSTNPTATCLCVPLTARIHRSSSCMFYGHLFISHRSVATMQVFSWSFVVLVLLSSSWAEVEIATLEVDTSQELSVGELLERANRDRTPDFDEPTLIGGDIAVRSEADRNADPCTSNGCLWLKYTDGKVYIPYYIANHYSDREREIIVRGLDSFSTVSCIRFRPYQNGDHEWLSIESRNGCYSYVGRVGGGQTVSLSSQGCLYHSTVQHELLHALGFNHEQTRSDRDNHILVHWDNIIEGMEYNFYKINTLNQGTPYDYNSVMQYERYAFSKNNLPTMEPIPDSNVSFGKATQMSQNDIDRLNRLYNC
uniref:Metalloendopeptidase n=1 Tax=Xiphophorus maculatus TaxID=8083 RepID=A0A3B5Q4T5_XIPMA